MKNFSLKGWLLRLLNVDIAPLPDCPERGFHSWKPFLSITSGYSRPTVYWCRHCGGIFQTEDVLMHNELAKAEPHFTPAIVNQMRHNKEIEAMKLTGTEIHDLDAYRKYEARLGNLNKENYFNAAMKKWPMAVSVFCTWIDDYKSKPDGFGRQYLGWKFHDLPLKEQKDIMQLFMHTHAHNAKFHTFIERESYSKNYVMDQMDIFFENLNDQIAYTA